MRDLVVREAIRTMAEDAAVRFDELIAQGAELPYDLREPGNGSPLPQYIPLTERFIREHAAQLRELDSFGAACAALESADLAAPYLERLEIPVPPESRRRAELACVVFLCRLWDDSADFSLAPERLSAAVEELEAGGETGDDEIEVIVPIRGLQLDVPRLELATATIVRADTVEVPAEARSPEGTGAAAWEPTYLAVARVSVPDTEDDEDPAPDAGARAVEAFRHLTTTLRLYGAGGVGLGPHAWARSGAHRWRRIATGAGRPRGGGYRLAEDELGELVAFSRALAQRANPFGSPAAQRPGLAGALARAISRFEAGLERHAVLEALSDYLLSLRFLLEGGGPADLGLSMRVAALCAEPDERAATKAVVDRALALERELWTGEPAPAPEGALTPAEAAVAIEDLARAILKDAACGHLGSDLRATADEILLADGLSVGEGAPDQRGETAEWDPAESAEVLEDLVWDDDPEWGAPDEAPVDPEEHDEEPVEEPREVPAPMGRITITRALEPERREENVFVHDHARAHADEAVAEEPVQSRAEVAETRAEELLAERPQERQRIEDRVAYLFPRPETTEWSVREVAYDRRRRANVRDLRAS